MVKICFITTTSITISTFVIEIAKALHASGGFDITFICSDDAIFAASLPKYIHYHPITMKRGVSLKDLLVIGKIYKIFKKEKYDIIQFSTPNASLYASIAGKIAGIKKRLYAQWGIRYVGMNGCVRTFFKAIERFVCYLATDIRAVSYMNLDFAVNEGLYKRDKAIVLGKGGTIGVDLSIFDFSHKSSWREEVRDKLNLEDRLTFGFAGRISVDKGGRELITAFRQLLITNPKIQLLVVGFNEMEEEALSEEMNWALHNKQVLFTGFVQKDEMCKYYAAMDVLVHPTYREGFGMVLQEAAAMEVPIITTRIPGASEVMEEGRSCLLAEPRDVASLQNQMKVFIDNPKLIKDMGIAARKRTEEYYTRSQMVARQLEDYNTLMEE